MPARRILIRLGSLGDVVLATAAAQAARERWPDDTLDVLVKEEWAALWEGHPAVAQVHVWRREDRGLRGLRSWAARLRGAGYALALDLQSSLRTRLLCALAGIPAVRPRRYPMRRRWLARFRWWGPPATYRVVRAFVEVVAPGAGARPSVHPGEAARARALALVPAAGGVALVPGSRHATKRWPLARFVELGRGLAPEYGPPAVCFGPDETWLREEWSRLWGGTTGWIAVQEDLPTTAAVLARLDVVVTNDTGLMHLAGAVGTPVVALFGPTVPSLGFGPTGPRDRVLERAGLECRPCSIHGGPRCPRGHFQCLAGIEAATVGEAVHAVGETGGPGAARSFRGASGGSAHVATHPARLG